MPSPRVQEIRKSDKEKEIYLASKKKNLLTKYVLTTRGKNNFTVEKLSRYYHNQLIKVNITNNGIYHY